mmetsp:Transcript_2093/g.5312  ORF Transcript_2093/g.5312 Transcript_2093/m.5312 type:complete len:325 (-) Transcript_2093:89-1063(-)
MSEDVEEDVQEVQRNPDHKVTILKLSGSVITEVSPVPMTVLALKMQIADLTGTPVLLQKLINSDGVDVLEDGTGLNDENHEMMLVIDETNMWMWDWHDNPSSEQIQVDGPHARCPRLRSDFVNVLTKEPIRNGRHYFEFVMHFIGDEQSCGVVNDNTQAGNLHSLRSLTAWTYYPGRMGTTRGTIVDGLGALHAKGKAVKAFKKLRESGDIIGMLVDMDRAAIAFSLNGELQGACPIEVDKPLYVITHLDTPRDYVELRKPNLHEAPPDHLEALSGALLDISQGSHLRYGYHSGEEDEEDDYVSMDDDEESGNEGSGSDRVDTR